MPFHYVELKLKLESKQELAYGYKKQTAWHHAKGDLYG